MFPGAVYRRRLWPNVAWENTRWGYPRFSHLVNIHIDFQ